MSRVSPESFRPRARALPHLAGDVEVVDVLESRRRESSRPCARDDPHRVALVVEGGGMRGAYVGGMIAALNDHGLRDSFDEVYAVSSGAFSAAGLVLESTEHAIRVYADDLARSAFLSWRRFASRRGPLVSLDLLVDEVLERRGFRWSALTDASIPLQAVATPLDTMRAEALGGFATVEDWKLALRASATIPVLAGPPVRLRGRDFVDGFVGDALPIARAIASGATHVLALIARAPGELPRAAGKQHPVVRRRLDQLAPGLGEVMSARGTSYADSLALVTDPAHRHRGSARVLGVRAAWNAGVGALTTDSTRLWGAGGAGRAAIDMMLRVPPPR